MIKFESEQEAREFYRKFINNGFENLFIMDIEKNNYIEKSQLEQAREDFKKRHASIHFGPNANNMSYIIETLQKASKLILLQESEINRLKESKND